MQYSFLYAILNRKRLGIIPQENGEGCTGHMQELKKLPIGIEDFVEMRTEDFFLMDKTGLIKDLLENRGKVNLFTRPRRFGKSMNMSMLKAFFEIGCRKELFEGLAISEEKQLCDAYMGRFPVISVTLKGIDGLTFDEAFASVRNTIGREAMRFQYLLDSEVLSEWEKDLYAQLIKIGNGQSGMFDMTPDVLELSLQTLSLLLSKHHGRDVVILIDEYDVPLDKANQHGYYEQMVNLIRKLFGNALKTNENLQFAVLTGCLRVSKESIFTGLNNLRILSITSAGFNEYFGFTDREVRAILDYYGLGACYEEVREWYDGYVFGDENIYCPWDVINYCDELTMLRRKNPDGHIRPKNYWANTSGNVIIRKLLGKAKGQTKAEIEQLVAGGILEKRIEENLTYQDLDGSVEHIWSVLFATGYLTYDGITEEGMYRLRIPNREIRSIFVSQIMEWFQETAQAEPSKLDVLCDAVLKGDAETVQNSLKAYLKKTISVRDMAVKTKKENFFHGMLLGLLGHREEWRIRSNVESGDGYSDILLMDDDSETGIVIEVKYAEKNDLDAGCRDALAQIEKKHYEAFLEEEGMTTIIRYGMAFFRKNCRVVRDM